MVVRAFKSPLADHFREQEEYMTEINEREYLNNIGVVPMIIWGRTPHDTSLRYVNHDGYRTMLKYRTHNFMKRTNVFRRLFVLTDDDVVCMVVPRII